MMIKKPKKTTLFMERIPLKNGFLVIMLLSLIIPHPAAGEIMT